MRLKGTGRNRGPVDVRGAQAAAVDNILAVLLALAEQIVTDHQAVRGHPHPLGGQLAIVLVDRYDTEGQVQNYVTGTLGN